ncbi:ribose-5-phosphate isomerase RpiA [Limosilactobacillus equigenerosi]|uniref:Ribose-5-phosphate isomerase A n=1 Tax=Limosilactobacillus equigenerosi DSM 18793 = JCM 14505 TaxID=1423742 RepID=A0A0R1UWD8_9LACO|nr:ribose-5-phosphate isomerase RpiA [Limosilactobacillus equigenerosi]KRL95266.1 ribose-5-phosphate isomerase A [Limosilactobacillus equigenerosi DSM 18793 = JCM 14505]
MDQNELKALVGQAAVKYIEDGMIVGLGTGSTVRYLVDALGERVKNEGLNIIGVTTSNRTTEQATSLGITIKDLDEVDHVDLTIDGADEVDPNFFGIKGGGGALLWEKIVNNASTKNMWIVDESKLVDQLGDFGLPVEVIPFGASHVFSALEAKGYQPEWRMDGDQKYRTDEGNLIIDLRFGKIADLEQLANELIQMVGVVEHGLFLHRVDTVIVGRQDGPEVLGRELSK